MEYYDIIIGSGKAGKILALALVNGLCRKGILKRCK